MCYHVAQKLNHKITFNDTTRESELLDRPMVGGFSGQPIAVMKPTADRKSFDVVGMEWGFLPYGLQNRAEVKMFKSGYKNSKGMWVKGKTTLNAHSSKLFINDAGNTAMWAQAVRTHRCLVPISGYFDWRHVYRKNKRTGEDLKIPDKYPYYVQIKGQKVIYLAGIWQEWSDHDTGERVDTLAFCTAEANSLAAKVHNSKMRMPAMLNTDLANAWMFNELTDEDITVIAKIQFPAAEMEAWPVNKEFQALADPTALFNYPTCPPLDEVPLSNDNTLSLF